MSAYEDEDELYSGPALVRGRAPRLGRLQRAAVRSRQRESARRMAEYEAGMVPVRRRLQREYTEREVREARLQAERRTRETMEAAARAERVVEESRRIRDHLATSSAPPSHVIGLATAVCHVAGIDPSAVTELLQRAYRHGEAVGAAATLARIEGTPVVRADPYAQPAETP